MVRGVGDVGSTRGRGLWRLFQRGFLRSHSRIQVDNRVGDAFDTELAVDDGEESDGTREKGG